MDITEKTGTLEEKIRYSQCILEKYSREIRAIDVEQETLSSQQHLFDSYETFLERANQISLISDVIFIGLFLAVKAVNDSNLAVTALQIGIASCVGLVSGYTLLKSSSISQQRIEKTMGDLSEFEMKLYNNRERYKGLTSAYYDLQNHNNSLETTNENTIKRR